MSKARSQPAPEPVLFTTPIGLNSLGSVFDSDAPFAGCRLCGALYQSGLDRSALTLLRQGALYEFMPGKFSGSTQALGILQLANERRERWRQIHERRYHTETEIKELERSGNAFTPEAAHKLAPFGVVALSSGYDDAEVAAAMLEAPRAPVNDVES